MNAATLSPLAFAAAALLVFLAAAMSLVLQLRVARSLLAAAARMVVQLLLVGFALHVVFGLHSPLLVAGVLVVMSATASYEVLSRQEKPFVGRWRYGLGAGTMLIATLVVVAVGVAAVRPSPWYEPQVVIPLFGIVLGSVMNGVSISLNAFTVAVSRERTAIEAQLALGATRYAALRGVQRTALRSGLIPIINQMSAAGIITLPGMMTGQILAGMQPFEAAQYQIFVLCLLAGATSVGAVATTALAVRRVTDDRDRLRLDRMDL